jgi:hypothetical protein
VKKAYHSVKPLIARNVGSMLGPLSAMRTRRAVIEQSQLPPGPRMPATLQVRLL